METVWRLRYEHDRQLPDAIDSDVRMPPALAERLVREFTAPGDAVLDPFAGFGTTLRVAGDCDRQAYGVEYEPDHVEYIDEMVEFEGELIHGDARRLEEYDLPDCAAVVTSPPFMGVDMERDPLQNYAGESDYESYLDEMGALFASVGDNLGPDGTVALNVVNLKHDGSVTPLAWDLAEAIGEELHFDGEIVVHWAAGEDRSATADGDAGTFGYGNDHSYVLLFSKAE
jgi:hypothetical protein